MKTPEAERLLADILVVDEYPAFRAELRERLRVELEARAGRRRMTHWLAGLAMAAGITLYLGLPWPVSVLHRDAVPLAFVRSQPLRPGQLVLTERRDAGAVPVVRSADLPSYDVTGTAEMLRSSTWQADDWLSDQELLRLLGDRSVALVTISGTQEQLVWFAGPETDEP